jgi:hypothetical protein
LDKTFVHAAHKIAIGLRRPVQGVQVEKWILRSAFAILYAAWEDGQEWVDSKKEKWGKEKLARLYNRFKESQVSDNQTKELVTGGDSPYAYYIPFVKKQIEDANIPDLTWMYQTLLNNENLDEVKFNQSSIGTSTKKALESATAKVVKRMIQKQVFTN